MRALSPDDGSAEAIRAAAETPVVHDDHRVALERELDRLNLAIQGSAAALSQHLSWMLVSQAAVLLAYLIVLVNGWSVSLPGRRELLLGLAAFGVIAVVFTYLGLRGARDRVGPLKSHRQRVEDALERVAGRPPVFARQGTMTALLANASTRGLPLMIVAGWTALIAHTLVLPTQMPETRGGTVVEPRSSAEPVQPARSVKGQSSTSSLGSAAASSTTSGANAASAPGSKLQGTTPAAATAADTSAEASPESPVLRLLRRAVATPASAEPQERVAP
jgi:hypothetical protein